MNDIETTSVARRIVEANMYMTIATADSDGRPWVSPVWFAPRSEAEFLWVSSPDARHSRDIAVREEIAIVIFDSTVRVGAAEAVYVEAVPRRCPAEISTRQSRPHSTRSQRHGADTWAPTDVLPPARVRLYRATAGSQFVLGPGDERLPVHMGK
jgi:hypothetical protein